MDFRNPSIGNIWNFFWYIFHDLNRCPSTIEGYRTTIADTFGDSNPHISSNTDIARLISSFYRDKPKHSRSLPKWNLSLVLHKLTQPPFELTEECTLKLLTGKTVFLLALASGKRCSEIHAWTYDRTLSLGNWEQVQLTPSPSIIAKNQLAKEGPNIISLVIIPALKYDPQKTLRTQIFFFALSGPSNVIWIGQSTPDHVDSYFLSPTNWATQRILSALLSRLGSRTLFNSVTPRWNQQTWTS